MTPQQLHILRHSLGLDDKGRGKAYREHFVTGPGSKDYDDCMALVESGHMVRREGSELSGGDDIFLVTELGKKAAKLRTTPGEWSKMYEGVHKMVYGPNGERICKVIDNPEDGDVIAAAPRMRRLLDRLTEANKTDDPQALVMQIDGLVAEWKQLNAAINKGQL